MQHLRPGPGAPVWLFNPASRAAVTGRDPGRQTVWVPTTASRPQFAEAMTTARRLFAANLRQHGVFHDAGAGRIDIDPLANVGSREDVRANHFKSGLGVFPPHAAV